MPDGSTPDIPTIPGTGDGTGTPKTQVPVPDSGQTTPDTTGNLTLEQILEKRRQALLAAKGTGEPGQPGSDVPEGSVPDIEIGPVRPPGDDAHDVNEFVDTANNAERTSGGELRAPSGKVLPAPPTE